MKNIMTNFNFKEYFSKTSFKMGGAAVVVTALFLVAIIALNLFAGALTDRFDLKFDMTKNEVYELSDTSKELAANLKEQVNVYVLSSEVDFTQNNFGSTVNYSALVNEILKKYAAVSNGTIQINYVDIYQNPAFTTKYETTAGLTPYDIIFETEKRFKVLNLTDFYEFSYDAETQSQNVVANLADPMTASAITYVTSEKTPVAVFVTGHEETIPYQLTSLFETNNYETQEINLQTADIPENTSVAIIVGPMRDYSGEELSKLDRYFKSGGNGIIMIDPASQGLSNLNAYCQQWGVLFENNIIADDKMAVGHPLNLVPLHLNHEINKGVYATGVITLFPSSRSITKLFSAKGDYETTSVISTSASSYGKKVSEAALNETVEKTADDKSGPFDVGVLSKYSAYSGETKITSEVLFLGGVTLIAPDYLQSQSFGNREFLAGVATYFNKDAKFAVTGGKSLQYLELVLTTAQQDTIFIIFVILLPLALVIAGLVIFIKRRNL